MKKYVAFFLFISAVCGILGYVAGKDRALGESAGPESDGSVALMSDAESGAGAAAPSADAGIGKKGGPQAKPAAASPNPAKKADASDSGRPATEIIIDTRANPALMPDPRRTPAGMEQYAKASAKSYVVRNGDNLTKIGNAFKVPFELIMRLNGKKGPDLSVGERLAVLEGPFNVVVDVSERIAYLMKGDTCVKSYPVAVGPGGTTPRGRFEVQSKIKNPDWTNPETRNIVPHGDPTNPLGSRWIAFTQGYGIHGTNDPDSIGSATSKGCIRMQNADVEELFDFLRHGDSKVEIVD